MRLRQYKVKFGTLCKEITTNIYLMHKYTNDQSGTTYSEVLMRGIPCGSRKEGIKLAMTNSRIVNFNCLEIIILGHKLNKLSNKEKIEIIMAGYV